MPDPLDELDDFGASDSFEFCLECGRGNWCEKCLKCPSHCCCNGRPQFLDAAF